MLVCVHGEDVHSHLVTKLAKCQSKLLKTKALKFNYFITEIDISCFTGNHLPATQRYDKTSFYNSF